MKVTLNIYIPKIYEYENHFNKSITGAYERREAAQRRVKLQYVLQTHPLSNHTFANCLIWKTSVNCVSDLSRRDKCLLIKYITNRLSCV